MPSITNDGEILDRLNDRLMKEFYPVELLKYAQLSKINQTASPSIKHLFLSILF